MTNIQLFVAEMGKDSLGNVMWSYPAEIKFELGDCVVLKIFHFETPEAEFPVLKSKIRPANQFDFDRLILDASSAQLKIERFISEIYKLQKQASF